MLSACPTDEKLLSRANLSRANVTTDLPGETMVTFARVVRAKVTTV
jgi:hypothetical protein